DYVLASMNDITERKQLDEMKDQFAGVVSHEIRTPIAIISAIVDSLYDEIEGPLLPDQKELIVQAKRSVRRLNHIMEGLSHYVRFEMGLEDIQLKSISLSHFFKELVNNYQMLAKEAEKTFEAHIEKPVPEILCDPTLVLQI